MSNKLLKSEIKKEYRRLFLETENDLSNYKLVKEYLEPKKYYSKIYENNKVCYDFEIIQTFICYINCRLYKTLNFVKPSYIKIPPTNYIKTFPSKSVSVYKIFLPIIFNRRVYKLIKNIKKTIEDKNIQNVLKNSPIDSKLLERRIKINKIKKQIKK